MGTAKPRPSPRQIAELRLLFLYAESTRGMSELYGLIRSGKSLAAALAQLDLHEPGWRKFVSDTVSKYRAELSADRGALSNPDDVRFVQRALNLSLGSNLTVDGVWGSATGEKLVEFRALTVSSRTELSARKRCASSGASSRSRRSNERARCGCLADN